MSNATGAPQNGLVFRLSVPSAGPMRDATAEMTAKIALALGCATRDTEAVRSALETLASNVAPPGTDDDIVFEFSRSGETMVVEARSGSHTAKVQL